MYMSHIVCTCMFNEYSAVLMLTDIIYLKSSLHPSYMYMYLKPSLYSISVSPSSMTGWPPRMSTSWYRIFCSAGSSVSPHSCTTTMHSYSYSLGQPYDACTTLNSIACSFEATHVVPHVTLTTRK